MKNIFDIRNDEIILDAPYWKEILLNQKNTLLLQWSNLQTLGVLDNFRLQDRFSDKRHNAIPNSDSLLYQWIEAASSYLKAQNNAKNYELQLIEANLQKSIELIEKTQEQDGYIDTYHQYFLKKSNRWKSLYIGKEINNTTSLILAGISHFNATQKTNLISIAQKAAQLIITKFLKPTCKYFPGNIAFANALIALFDITSDENYLLTAIKICKVFPKATTRTLARIDNFKLLALTSKRHLPHKISQSELKFRKKVNCTQKGESFIVYHKNETTEEKLHYSHAIIAIRNRAKELNIPFPNELRERKQFIFKNFKDFLANYLHYNGTLAEVLTPKQHLTISRRANPLLQWNSPSTSILLISCLNELFRSTKDPICADLVGWIYYNTLSASFSANGTDYSFIQKNRSHRDENIDNANILSDQIYNFSTLYHQFSPMPISSAIAKIKDQIYLEDQNDLYLLQLVNNTITIPRTGSFIQVFSQLPYGNEVTIRFVNTPPRDFKIHIRIPAWAEGYSFYVNGKKNDSPEIIMPPFVDKWTPHWFDASFLTIKLNESIESKSIQLIFSNNTRFIDYPNSSLTKRYTDFSNCKFFIRNMFLYYFEGSINENAERVDFKINLDVPLEPVTIGTLFPDGVKSIPSETTCLIASTTTSKKVILLPWAIQANFTSFKQIPLPTVGGIGDWSSF